MKAKKIIGLLGCVFGLGIFSTSCEDMLTPELKRYAEDFNGTDTVNFYLGILGDVQDVVEQNYLLGDLRSDVATTTEYSSDSVADIMNFNRQPDGNNQLLNRSAYYKVINQCNFYLNRVDTLASKNGNFFMRKEAAQVLLIRAWTYMQLVQNYGKVPFITKPVKTAGTGWEKNPPQGFADVHKLLDLLKADVERALMYEDTYGYPDYGTFNLGDKSYPYKKMIFPARLVLADLYLLRGASKSDFETAARYYYNYLVKDRKNSGFNLREYEGAKFYLIKQGDIEKFTPYSSSWINAIPQGVFTSIPSASNNSFGKVLTKIPNTYGYDTHSQSRTSVSEQDSKEEAVVTSGSMQITPNFKNNQVIPSKYFEALNKSQVYVYPKTLGSGQNTIIENLYYVGQGDARMYATTLSIRDDHKKYSFVQKVVNNSHMSSLVPISVHGFNGKFNNSIGIYRHSQILLRYAEAINRAGFPRHAFAVLHGGCVAERMPGIKIEYKYDDVNKQKTAVYVIDSVVAGFGANNFIDIDELRRAKDVDYLDYSGTVFSDSKANTIKPLYIGVHNLGTGLTLFKDTVNTFEKLVATRIVQEAKRNNKEVSMLETIKRLKGNHPMGDTVRVSKELQEARKTYEVIDAVQPLPADPQAIDAVESLISDETALQNSFLGERYYDLMRIARHKNNDQSGEFAPDNGTKWFAWQIARRNVDEDFYGNINNYDATIFNKLLDQSNWYLRNPEY